MLADAFNALSTFDWGADIAVLAPIDDAAVAEHGDANARHDLEQRLIAALKGNLSRDAHDYVCRKLAIVGTAASVPALAPLLGNKATSHMARYALERIKAAEAAQALRTALATTQGNLKIGVISSLGARRDTEAVAALGNLLRDGDPALARAAALSLGAIGNTESATALQSAFHAGAGDKQALLDGLLACAEALLARDQKTEALSIYNSLLGGGHERLVRLAATRGVLACAARQD